MVVGALGAIMQNDIKRMMAYSSIAHMGYALAGLAAELSRRPWGCYLYDWLYFHGAGSFAIILLMRRMDRRQLKWRPARAFAHTPPCYVV